MPNARLLSYTASTHPCTSTRCQVSFQLQSGGGGGGGGGGWGAHKDCVSVAHNAYSKHAYSHFAWICLYHMLCAHYPTYPSGLSEQSSTIIIKVDPPPNDAYAYVSMSREYTTVHLASYPGVRGEGKRTRTPGTHFAHALILISKISRKWDISVILCITHICERSNSPNVCHVSFKHC